MIVFSTTAILLFWLPLLLLVYHWVLFPLVLALVVRLRRTDRAESPENNAATDDSKLPRVTVAIAARNEEAVIRQKLENTLLQDYPAEKIEVLVGSDASTDATDDIVRSFADRRVVLNRLEPHGGKAAVLNMLMERATGDLILFTDADVILSSDTVRRLARRFSDSRVGAAQARYLRSSADGSPAEGIFDRFDAKLKELEGRLGAMVGAYGCALMLRRSLCRPLPAGAILDDFLLGVSPFWQGYDAVYEEGGLATTRVEDEKTEFRRRVRIGRGNLQALVICRNLLLPRYGIKAWVLFSHKVLRMAIPFLLLLMFVGSLLLVRQPFFMCVFLLQLVVYGTVWLVPRARGFWRLLLMPQYFVWANLAQLVGFWQFFAGRERDRPWVRTPRR